MTAPRHVSDVVTLYLAHSTNDQSVRTYEGRRRVLTAFATVNGDLSLADARPFHLRLWVDAQDRWKSDWTRKGVISAVQRCFNWAAKLGIIDRNPFHGLSNREGDPGRPMREGEFRAMLRASTVPFRRVLVFLRYAGCRPGELAQIRPEHCDLERGVVVLPNHKTAKTRRQRKPRVIVLHPVNVSLLRFLMREMFPGQETVFVNCRGNPWCRYSLSCRVKKLREKLKLPRDCKLYGLRYGYASAALHHHLDLKTLSVLLGHASVTTTQRYCRIDGDLDHLADSVKRIFGEPK